MTEQPRTKRRSRRGTDTNPRASERATNYRQLRSPLPTMNAVSEDEAANIHASALTVLKDLGMRVLNAEAFEIFRKAGARVEGDMVYLDETMINAAIASAPKSIPLIAGARHRDLTLELGALVFQPGAGCPHATDLLRGRRPGTSQDFRELIQLTQAFDALHMLPPLVEPQDVPIQLRHYDMTRAMLTGSDKFPFVFSRGTPQVMDCFEMIRDFRGVSDAEFQSNAHCYTIVNTNSPRTLDVPMAQGLMDFARAGQMSIVTPFTLMGAMAPITVAGAITLSHAEALAAITLVQLTNPGAPVSYGTFTSNVDMKSGAPAFGTPEHFHASLLAGQMARMIGLPWRSAAGSAANINDAQAANETQFGLWGCLLAGASIVIHSAGWLEGGLTISYEKLITDMEVVNMVADLCAGMKAGPDEIGLDALREVAPQGHFFATTQTMARYSTEFYEPVIADWSNIGQWEANGAQDASKRATGKWQELLKLSGPNIDHNRVADLDAFIAKRSAEGGAPPES